MQVPDALKWLVGVAVSAFLVGFGAYRYLKDYNAELTASIEKQVKERVEKTWDEKLGGIAQRTSIPVGTIVASTHPLDRLKAANGAVVSDWVPCGGRDSPENSAYRRHIDTKVPDLRGQFLRGANVMMDGSPKAISSRLDPDGTLIGEYQSDTFLSHNHEGNVLTWPHEGGGGPDVIGVLIPETRRNGGKAKFSVPNDGGNETRPKNIAVAFYVKVN